MTKFNYRAKDWNGKNVYGVIDSSDKQTVIESVKNNGLILLAVSEQKNGLLGELSKKVLNRVGLKQVATLTRELATMMNSGLPLTDALSLLRDQSENNPSLYEILDNCLTGVRGGLPLGRCLEKYEGVFGEAYVASIKAGEEGGVLEEVLSKLAINLENQDEFVAKVKGAMVYPVIVIVGMIAVAIIMMVVVIPKLMGLYADFGDAKLPAITQGMMAVSNFMAKWWFLLPVLIGGAIPVFRIGSRLPNFRYKRDKIILKIPIAGELIQKTILANTIRTLSMLLTAGITLVDALRIVSNVADNEVFNQAFLKIAERVQKGFSISSSFEETGEFPIIVNQMVSTGEATGKLDEVLQKVSEYFSKEAEQSVKALTSAIEPLIMIVLGIGVGFLVVAVLMPIYNLTSQF
ncbi:MAG TPA: type II secretion system F family protein [Candidatus Woesebacteria bacterium]|nr:type II secretion system F family protein [Candidatus Woesebacteria bacterium]HPJ17146.1 type II secretion system F family protein [Candidatus Woesebacteria bacterium]